VSLAFSSFALSAFPICSKPWGGIASWPSTGRREGWFPASFTRCAAWGSAMVAAAAAPTAMPAAAVLLGRGSPARAGDPPHAAPNKVKRASAANLLRTTTSMTRRAPIDPCRRRRHDAPVTTVLGRAAVERGLPMGACIEAMAAVLADLARGKLSQPLRSGFAPPSAGGFLVWMPAHRSGPNALFAVKVLCIVPDNPTRGLDAHQGAVLLMD